MDVLYGDLLLALATMPVKCAAGSERLNSMRAASTYLPMCGRVIQSSGPLRLTIVEGLDVSDSRMGNVRPRYNAAPSQELLVIRQIRKQVSGHSTLSGGA